MSDEAESLRDIALAVSAFRSDDAVIALLRAAFAPGQPRFGAVLVVDSLGSGAIERKASECGWNIIYHNSERNLGSAGNLDLRLRTAASLGMKWCFASNHDGAVDIAKVADLAQHGRSRARVGAVYPQLIFDRAGGRLDSPRRRLGTYGVLRKDETVIESDCSEVAWSSSNGALYNLDAIREGVHAWPELWMGYEDLAIGWELQQRGWAQLLCTDIQVADNYEFSPVRLLGWTIHLADKPNWYMYYQARNLVLIARRSSAVSWTSVLCRMIVDVGLIVVFRSRKRDRLRLLFTGLRDGLRNVSGKGPVP